MMDQTTNPILDNENCLEILRKKFKNNSMDDYSLIKYNIVPVEECMGHLCKYFYLKVTVAKPESPTDSVNVIFFIKMVPPKGSKQYDTVCNNGMFDTEIQLYTKIFPEILVQTDREFIPECYLGIEKNILVLDDMVSKNFTMFKNKFLFFDFDHSIVVIKTLGRYHAKSMIFEQHNKISLLDFYERNKICLESYLNPKQGLLLNLSVNCVFAVLDALSEIDSSSRDKFKILINEISFKIPELMASYSKGRKVQDHGDLYSLNLMFKYNEHGKPMQCCFVDFQTSCYSPPAYDLLLFLYYTVEKDMRNVQFETFLKVYYDSVQLSLKEADMDIEKIFPWSEFIESISEFKLVALIRAIIAFPLVMCDYHKENKESLKTIDFWELVAKDAPSFYSNQLKESERFKNRFLDIILELDDFV